MQGNVLYHISCRKTLAVDVGGYVFRAPCHDIMAIIVIANAFKFHMYVLHTCSTFLVQPVKVKIHTDFCGTTFMLFLSTHGRKIQLIGWLDRLLLLKGQALLFIGFYMELFISISITWVQPIPHSTGLSEVVI